jgi:transcription elongation factor Elf1
MRVSLNCELCKKQSEPCLDKKTKKIHCGNCDKVQPDNHYLKYQLETLQLWRSGDKKPFWNIKCDCGSIETPKISKDEKNVLCSGCGQAYKLSVPFKIMMIEQLKKIK